LLLHLIVSKLQTPADFSSFQLLNLIASNSSGSSVPSSETRPTKLLRRSLSNDGESESTGSIFGANSIDLTSESNNAEIVDGGDVVLRMASHSAARYVLRRCGSDVRKQGVSGVASNESTTAATSTSNSHTGYFEGNLLFIRLFFLLLWIVILIVLIRLLVDEYIDLEEGSDFEDIQWEDASAFAEPKIAANSTNNSNHTNLTSNNSNHTNLKSNNVSSSNMFGNSLRHNFGNKKIEISKMPTNAVESESYYLGVNSVENNVAMLFQRSDAISDSNDLLLPKTISEKGEEPILEPNTTTSAVFEIIEVVEELRKERIVIERNLEVINDQSMEVNDSIYIDTLNTDAIIESECEVFDAMENGMQDKEITVLFEKEDTMVDNLLFDAPNLTQEGDKFENEIGDIGDVIGDFEYIEMDEKEETREFGGEISALESGENDIEFMLKELIEKSNQMIEVNAQGIFFRNYFGFVGVM
jgi:hypothetical protein